MSITHGRPFWLTTMLVSAATVLTACGSGGNAEADAEALADVAPQLRELYETAQEDGQTAVTVYGPGAGALEPLATAFGEQFPGVTVQLVELVGADTITRLGSEFTSGQHTADVAFGPVNQGIWTPDYADWFVDPGVVGAELPEAALAPEGQNWVSPLSEAYGFAYNTEVMEDPSALPTDWADVLDPKWEGRIVMADPSVASSSSVAIAYALGAGKVDDQWMEGVAANEPLIVEPARRSQALISGESDLSLHPLQVLAIDQRNGAPVEFIGSTAVTTPVANGLIDGAPNPEAARLWISWLFTEDAQQLYSEIGQIGVMPGAPAPVEGIEVSEPLSLEEYQDLYRHVHEVFGSALP